MTTQLGSRLTDTFSAKELTVEESLLLHLVKDREANRIE